MNTEVPKDKRKEIVLTSAPRVLAEREGRDMPREIQDEDERPEERPVVESGGETATTAGRYATEANEETTALSEDVEREERRKVGYFEHLQEQLAKLRLPRNIDLNLLEKFRSVKGTSTSSSSKRQEKE